MFDEGRVLANNLSYFIYLYSERNLSFVFIAAFDFRFLVQYDKIYFMESIRKRSYLKFKINFKFI